MNKIICAILILISINAKSQIRELNIVDLLKTENDSNVSVFYLSALWCHPCMQKLPDVQKLKIKYPEANFYFIFDSHFDTKRYLPKIYTIIDSSDFYVFPKKYYPQRKSRLINIRAGSSSYMINNFKKDIQENKLFTFDDEKLGFGHAIIKANGKIYLTTNTEKLKFIKELENYLMNSK